MKEFVTWERVEIFVNAVVKEYSDKNIVGVYGVPRGGLVLAVMISHKLGIPLLGAPMKDCIIVDDICDTGETLLHYEKNSSAFSKPLYHIITMYYKENELRIVPEYYMYTKNDKWIIFPWEVKED